MESDRKRGVIQKREPWENGTIGVEQKKCKTIEFSQRVSSGSRYCRTSSSEDKARLFLAQQQERPRHVRRHVG